jgi:hypothetical protein
MMGRDRGQLLHHPWQQLPWALAGSDRPAGHPGLPQVWRATACNIPRLGCDAAAPIFHLGCSTPARPPSVHLCPCHFVLCVWVTGAGLTAAPTGCVPAHLCVAPHPPGLQGKQPTGLLLKAMGGLSVEVGRGTGALCTDAAAKAGADAAMADRVSMARPQGVEARHATHWVQGTCPMDAGWSCWPCGPSQWV